MGIESLVPAPLKNPYRRLRSALKNRSLGTSNADIFDAVYRDALWGQSPEGDAYSGSGTYDPAAATYVAFVRSFITENKVRSIVEIGCGDFAIGRQYASDVDRYIGADVSNYIVARNVEKFGSEKISFVNLDASEHDLPASDLCVVRQVLQHLDNGSINRILARVAAHKFVLITEHLPSPSRLRAPNLDKRSGPDTRLTFDSGVYIELPPFERPVQTVLSLPVAEGQAHQGEVMRTTLLTNVC